MKTLLDLEPSDCRWPVTDDRPHLFCGEPKLPGSSYCACHKPLSVSAEQPDPVSGRRLARLADFLAGGRARTAPNVGSERSRAAVDTYCRQTLGNAGLLADERAFR